MRVRVALTPDLESDPDRTPTGWPRDARRWTGVAIDVLRATSTLTVALQNGACRVVPAATPAEAFARREREPDALICGEREGRKVVGFDLGNSPFEYDRATVAGRVLVFASTNGSPALRAAARARRIVAGAFVNAEAAAAAVAADEEVVVVCAGKLGGFALEDAACAGRLVARLAARGARPAGAAAALALALAPRDAAATRALVQGSAHGRYLRSLGPDYARDVEFCAGLDTLDAAFEL
jgi:2-phosphosulfolactate phosphatase